MNRFPKVCLSALLAAFILILAAPLRAQEPTMRGRIKMVDPDQKELVLTDAENKDFRFALDMNAKITINGREAKLSEVQPDDMADIIYRMEGERRLAGRVTCNRL
jgi:hypothetical protein